MFLVWLSLLLGEDKEAPGNEDACIISVVVLRLDIVDDDDDDDVVVVVLDDDNIKAVKSCSIC